MQLKTRKPAGRSGLRIETLERREVFAADGFVTAAPAYLVPTALGVEVKALLTVGDAVPETNPVSAGDTYRMVGIPDGLGAFDNGDGTFTVLMNHELANNVGIVREHGGRGSFVSKYIIDKSTLEVLSGDDLIQTVYVWDAASGQYVVGTGALNALNRLCSADLPETTAFFNPATGLGTTTRIFMNGEETSNGRAFANIVNGPEAGTIWDLPWTGKYAWENHVASPFAQDKTIVMGLDDSRRDYSSEGSAEPSEVYVWVGQKQATGLEIEKAGLRTGVLHGLRVGTAGNYDANESTVASGERFELVPLSDQTNNTTFSPLQTESIAKTITQFRRVEDGHFDPNNPNVFYYVTTDQFGGATRLWKLTFDDITQPELGGKIEIAINSPASVPGEMFDNMTVDANGRVFLQEDPGGNPYLAKVWTFDPAANAMVQVAQHNPALFGAPGIDLYPNMAGVQATQDEESSGIIDLSHILGEGYYLANVQAHHRFTLAADPTGELVEPGQLLILKVGSVVAGDGYDFNSSVAGFVVLGTDGNDHIDVAGNADALSVTVGGQALGTINPASSNVVVFGKDGNDHIDLTALALNSLVYGGSGNDRLVAGSGLDTFVGGAGNDSFFADVEDIFADLGNGNDKRHKGKKK